MRAMAKFQFEFHRPQSWLYSEPLMHRLSAGVQLCTELFDCSWTLVSGLTTNWFHHFYKVQKSLNGRCVQSTLYLILCAWWQPNDRWLSAADCAMRSILVHVSCLIRHVFFCSRVHIIAYLTNCTYLDLVHPHLSSGYCQFDYRVTILCGELSEDRWRR